MPTEPRALHQALASAARRAGAAHVEVYDAMPSTQDRARELARSSGRSSAPTAGADGPAIPAIVVALRQSAGRGRGGRAWASPLGGLWCSVVVEGAAGPPRVPLTLPAALAAAHALEASAPGLRIALKWPNDLFAGGRKLGGLLVDLEGRLAVVGVGLDVAVSPESLPAELSRRATSVLAERGSAPPLDVVLDGLVRALLPASAAWARGDARAAAAWVEDAWARSLLRDRVPPFRVEPAAGEPYRARALGLDADGALRVERTDTGAIQRLLSAHLDLDADLGPSPAPSPALGPGPLP